MELPKDREDFGRWVACAMGTPDPFYAFFHKPSAPNMVIIEVKRDWDGFDRLLGEHKWDEFLRNPSPEEDTKLTQVFYCRWNTGWKRVDAQESWFKQFSPKNSLITFPYPDTYFCTPPNEDLTNEPLCRPLPTSRFPAPPVKAAPVVRPAPPGSSGWVTQKSVPVQKARTRGASGRGAPAALRIPASPRGAVKSASAVNSSRGASSPWAPPGPVSAIPVSLNPNTSTRSNLCKIAFHLYFGILLKVDVFRSISGNREPPSTRALSSFKKSSSASDTSTSESSVFNVPLPVFDVPSPPGIDAPITSWADDVPVGLFPDIIMSKNQSTLPALSSNAALPRPAGHVEVHDHLEDAFEELGLADPTEGYAPNWEYEAAAAIPAIPVSSTSTTSNNMDSLWDDYDPEPKSAEKDELLCMDHGKICKKGICKTYHRQLKEAERAKKEAEWAAKEAEKGKGKGRGKGKGKGKGNSNASSSKADEQSWRSVSRSSNISSTPSAVAEDEDNFADAGAKGKARGRSRAGSTASAAPTEASGWGTFSQGPW
ncbi:hypothetical protein HWV62_11802 [Athelia sp. TMB]|nr:hypothetical protein HWV62_2029 [Athelia sp. TMB]KAF7984798.1 hypothetical protein HWV62_11802 [Athelia sp. TMB]